MTIQHAKIKLSTDCDFERLNKRLAIFDRVHVVGDIICYNGTLDAAEDLMTICRDSDPYCEIELHSETF